MTTLRPATPFTPVARRPATCTDACALPFSPAVSVGRRSTALRFEAGGAHDGPAENPFGDVQFGVCWIATRNSPIGRLNAATVTIAPSPRSTTRTLPVTAEPPMARNAATCPRLAADAAADGGESGAGRGSFDVAHPAMASAATTAAAA